MNKMMKNAVTFVLAGACTITMSLVNGNPGICKVAEASEKISGGELLKKISVKSEEQEAALQRKIEKNRKKQQKACLAYEDLTKSFQKKMKKSADEYPDYYGGAYINDNDILTINVTTDSTDIKEELQEVTQDQEVGFKKVKYEYSQLLDLYNMLGNKITDSQIADQVTGFYVDEVNNRIMVAMKDLSFVARFKEEISDSLMIAFEQGEEIDINATTKFKPGAQLVDDTAGFGYSSGYRCRKITSDGNYTIGVISAAHGNALKNKISAASGLSFGVVFTRKYSGNVDASYMRCLNSHYDLSNVIKYSGSSLAAGKYFKTVPVGTTVYKTGDTTHLTSGKVLSNNSSCTYDNKNFVDYICSSYKCADGDSGGLVYADSSGKYQIVGSHVASSYSASTGYRSYAVKVTNVISALGVTPY